MNERRYIFSAGGAVFLHGALFGLLGLVLARETRKPAEEMVLAVDIEFAEAVAGDYADYGDYADDIEAIEAIDEIEIVEAVDVIEPVIDVVDVVESVVDVVEPVEPLPEKKELDISEKIPSEIPQPPIETDRDRPPSTAVETPSAAVEIPALPDVLPAARNTIRKPPYPPDARRRGEEGTVVLELAISEKGVVTSVEIAASSGFPELDRAARKAAFSARFSPASKNGVPVPFTLRQPFEFKLLDR